VTGYVHAPTIVFELLHKPGASSSLNDTHHYFIIRKLIKPVFKITSSNLALVGNSDTLG
jgi:hypothetical protein